MHTIATEVQSVVEEVKPAEEVKEEKPAEEVKEEKPAEEVKEVKPAEEVKEEVKTENTKSEERKTPMNVYDLPSVPTIIHINHQEETKEPVAEAE